MVLLEINIQFLPRKDGIGKELLRRNFERSEQNEQSTQIDVFILILADTAVRLIGNSRTVAKRIDPHLPLFPESFQFFCDKLIQQHTISLSKITIEISVLEW